MMDPSRKYVFVMFITHCVIDCCMSMVDSSKTLMCECEPRKNNSMMIVFKTITILIAELLMFDCAESYIILVIVLCLEESNCSGIITFLK